MDKEYMDKLLHDIQQYFREEDKRRSGDRNLASSPISIRLEPSLNRPVYIELLLLIAASATAILTMVTVLLGAFGYGHPNTTSGAGTLLAVAACGIFFTAILAAVWRQLTLLSQIEENTRLILENRLEINLLLESLLKK